MRIHAIQHDPLVGLGVIDEWTKEKNITIHVTRIDLGEILPSIDSFDLLVILGGRMGAYEEDHFPWLVGEKEFIRKVVQKQKYVLGICLGAQLIAEALGGKAYGNVQPELGWQQVVFTPAGKDHPLLRGITDLGEGGFYQFHNDTFNLPSNACLLATNHCAKQAFAIKDHVLAVQFHPEFDEKIVSTINSTIYPREKVGPFIQSHSEVQRAPFNKKSRQFMFQVMNNFRKEISKLYVD